MSGIKVKLKNFWKSLKPVVQRNLIESIIYNKSIKRGDLTFQSNLIVNSKNFGNINLTITDNIDSLKMISEASTFPEDPEELIEKSVPIINNMIVREIGEVPDVEMTNLKRPGNEDFTEHDFDALDDAFSSLSVSNRDSGGIEMKGIDVGDRDGNRHDLDALMLALNKGGKTRKKRKRRTKKHFKKKSAKRMSRKK